MLSKNKHTRRKQLANRARTLASKLAVDEPLVPLESIDSNSQVDRVNQAHARAMQPAKNEFAALMQQLNATHDKK